MKLLAVETATEACSAALYIDGAVIERYQLAPREHTRLILPMAQSLLAEAGLELNRLDALAFGCGPGSFTGLRIAAGVIQGLALGAELPVVPVSTLAAMAQDVIERSAAPWVFPALDARMGEVYWGVYRAVDGLAERIGEECVCMAETVPCPAAARGVGAGSGWLAAGTELRQRLGDRILAVEAELYPRAAQVARLGAAGYLAGRALTADQAQPVYLRDQVAKKSRQ